MVFYRDRAYNDHCWALYLRSLYWAGYSLGEPVVKLWGERVVRRSLLEKYFISFLYKCKNEHVFDAFQINEESTGRYLDRIKRIKPTIIRGYVSALTTLVKIAKQRVFDFNLKAIITTAEKLHSYQRDMLEEIFKCKVFDHYACGECMAMAYECEAHEGLHESMEHCIIEFVDQAGYPVEDGKTGEVVVTDLDNFVTPFIRYKNGDLGAFATIACSCGRQHKLIKDILGRTSDMITGLNGTNVHGEFFTHLLEELDWFERYLIKCFCVIQQKDYSIDFKLVARKRPSQEECDRLRKKITEYMEIQDINIIFVDSIPLSGAGKHRFTVSRLNH